MTTSPERVLALLPNWIGDVAMCTPALRALRSQYPDAELNVAGRISACDLLAGLPWIQNRIAIPSRPGIWTLPSLSKVLRPYAGDITVVFPHSFRAAMLARLSGARIRIGYARGWRSALLTQTVAPHRENRRIAPVYMAREYLDLVAGLGCTDDGEGLELAAEPNLVSTIRAKFPPTGPRIGIAPGAAFGGSKRWPAERFAEAADTLIERTGATCVLLTGPGESDLRLELMGHAHSELMECHDGTSTIEDLKATVSQLDLLICNDSGARHVAVAFGVPTVCIMGPTKPAYSVGPYEKGQVLRIDVDCGPCQKPVCRTDHRCMTGISPEWVVDTALRILDE